MSTRTQLRFVDPDGNRVAQVYNHSDGYPDGIVPSLVALRDTLDETGWNRGPEYAAAQFVFLRKLSGLQFYIPKIAEAMGHLPEDQLSERKITDVADATGANRKQAESMMRMAFAMTSPEVLQQLDQPFFLGGHGVEKGDIHGDEEYIYEVTVPMGPRDDGEWQVKVSKRSHDGGFARQHGDETAWDNATWDYEGSLDGALEKYTDE